MEHASTDLSALVALPPAERLALVQALWDSLLIDTRAVPVSEMERTVVSERRASLRRHPDDIAPWHEVRAELAAEQEADENAATGDGSGQPGW